MYTFYKAKQLIDKMLFQSKEIFVKSKATCKYTIKKVSSFYNKSFKLDILFSTVPHGTASQLIIVHKRSIFLILINKLVGLKYCFFFLSCVESK